jgi:uncharacterized protein
MRPFAILLTILSAGLVASAEEQKKPEHVRVLLVASPDPYGHVWTETVPALRKALEADKRIEVRVIEDPDFLASPAVADYDVIFLHFTDAKQPLVRPKEVHENLANVVKQGKGLVVFHCTCTAFQDWPEFANLAGKVWNRDPAHSHDHRGPFRVKIAQPQHPIVQGMHDFDADDELYYCLVGDRPVEVLATAHSKDTDKDQPMAFVLNYGKGRVFHIALGHDVRSISMPGVAELLRRGSYWAATGLPLNP